MDQPVLKGLAVFAGWTITSFLCHYSAKVFLKESAGFMTGYNYNVIVLTCMQIAFCLILRPVPNENETKSSREKYIILIAHACATLTTNYSMVVMHAASTFAIKLTEPLTGALSQRLFLGASLSNMQWFSIPVTVYGALVFAEDAQHQDFKISFGSVLAFLSNICLALRNVFIKKKHQSNTEIAPNDKPYCVVLTVFCFIVALLLHYLSLSGVTPSRNLYLFALVIISSISHVLYSYISTVTVLKHFSVVSHAFANIMKRMIVICLLYMTGSRSASSWNFIGLFICIAGLSIYIWSKIQASSDGMKYLSKYKGLMTKFYVLVILASTAIFMFRSYFFNNDGSLQIIRTEDNFMTVPFPHGSKNVSLSQPVAFSIDEYFLMDLVANPEKANKLSPLLATRQDVISEAQRIQMNIFKTEIGKYKYAMLFGYDITENKGDPAIAVGEIILLYRLDIELIFACPTDSCTQKRIEFAYNLSKSYTDEELVILFHGGSNVVSSTIADDRRFLVMQRFTNFHIVMFPQSIMYIGSQSRKDYCKKMYASHKRLTFVWRDNESYKLGKKHFPNVRSLLSPDMAYQIGFVHRYMDPTHDIIWIKQTDRESPYYEMPANPSGYRMHVSDWLNWKTPPGTSPMENIFLLTTNGLTFLQRGRVVITDRLHGHILSTLLGIPHVYIDNRFRKISDYHNTWTAGLDNVILANSCADALDQAITLLTKLDSELPKITGYFSA